MNPEKWRGPPGLTLNGNRILNKGRETEEERTRIYTYIHTHTYTYTPVCITESLCYTPKINKILQMNYTSILKDRVLFKKTKKQNKTK